MDKHVTRLIAERESFTNDMQQRLQPFAYCFRTRGALSVAEYARHEKPVENEWERAYRESSTHVDRLFPLHYRLIGRVLARIRRRRSKRRLDGIWCNLAET